MRTWFTIAALLILPLLVYWPTVSHEYGFRDDYANLREVRERPGWLLTLTTSNGRPVYGLVLDRHGEVDEAATRIREEVYDEADIVVGAIFDRSLDGTFRVSVVATGLDSNRGTQATAPEAMNGQAAAVPSRTLQ